MKKSLWVSCGIVLVLTPLVSDAQQRFTSSIGSINKDGFYKVGVQPLVTAMARADYGDLRLLDENNTQVPFIITDDTGNVSQGKRWIPLPAPIIMQQDSSNKNTYVQAKFGEPYLVERIELHVTGPRFYKRRLSFVSDHYSENSFLYLTSALNNRYEIRGKSKAVQLTIYNGDNPPLKVDSIRAWQRSRGLVAYLKTGSTYRLVFGDSTLLAPEYDLAYFTDSIVNARDINTGPVTALNVKAAKRSKMQASHGLMWLLIVAAIAILLIFTLRLTSEIKGRDKGGEVH